MLAVFSMNGHISDCNEHIHIIISEKSQVVCSLKIIDVALTKSRGIFDRRFTKMEVRLLVPLLLTWFNFNPIMDK